MIRASTTCSCPGRCECASLTSGQSQAPCRASRRSPTASSSSYLQNGSTWTSWIGWSSPLEMRSAPSMSSCSRRARCDYDDIDALEALLGRHGVDRSHHRGPPALRATRPAPPQLGAYRPMLDRRAAGYASARTSTTAGHSTKSRSTSTTSAARSTLTFAGGRRWRCPRRSIQFVEVGEGATFVSLVCEDLAQHRRRGRGSALRWPDGRRYAAARRTAAQPRVGRHATPACSPTTLARLSLP